MHTAVLLKFTDKMCVSVAAYSVLDVHMYGKQPYQQEPTITLQTAVQLTDDDANMDCMDTSSGIPSPKQTIKDLQLEIR